jgi:hypothetical protein
MWSGKLESFQPFLSFLCTQKRSLFWKWNKYDFFPSSTQKWLNWFSSNYKKTRTKCALGQISECNRMEATRGVRPWKYSALKPYSSSWSFRCPLRSHEVGFREWGCESNRQPTQNETFLNNSLLGVSGNLKLFFLNIFILFYIKLSAQSRFPWPFN